MKASTKAVLARLVGRRARVVDVQPVITDVVPETELDVHETDAYTLLYAAIDRADSIDVKATTRHAALVGMEVLAESEPEELATIIKDAGAFGEDALKTAIMRLVGYGRAAMANA